MTILWSLLSIIGVQLALARRIIGLSMLNLMHIRLLNAPTAQADSAWASPLTGGESAAEVWARAQPLLTAQTPTLLVTHGGWLSVVLGHYGRPRTLEALFALKSPDLFSITPTGATQHEL